MNYFHPGCQVQQYPTLVNPCIWVLYDLLTHTSWLSPSPKTSLLKDAASFAGTRLSFTTIMYPMFPIAINQIISLPMTDEKMKSNSLLFKMAKAAPLRHQVQAKPRRPSRLANWVFPWSATFQSPTGPHPNPLANESQNAFSCLCKGRGAVH